MKRLSGKERRYQQWLNHNISTEIVRSAQQERASIAIEDLAGIRERTNQAPRSKTERRRSNHWAFHQLRLFLAYKAALSGVKLVAVRPQYTSQTCHHCLHVHPEGGKSYRSGKSFKCGHCGWRGDADLNGALTISLLGAAVNRPRGPGVCCNLRAAESRLSIA